MPDQISGLLSPWLRRRRFAAARPHLRPGAKVLDYGCGVGELAREVDPDLYLGVDRDRESLTAARAAHPGHTFLTPDEFESRPAEPEIDLVIALALIEHLPDPAAWLRSMRARLQPGGRIVLSTPEPRLQWAHDLGARLGVFSRAGAAEHQALLGRREMALVAQRAGLRIAGSARFLLGANQLFVLAKPEPAAGSPQPPSRPRIAGPLRWLGALLGLAGGTWVVTRLIRGGDLTGAQLSALSGVAVWGQIGLATLGYVALSVLAAGTWWWALGLCGPRPGFAAGWAIWARSQAAKYLPGNVFHYVGRQLLGRRAGLGHVALAVAAGVELISILAAAAVLAGAVRWEGRGELSNGLGTPAALALVLAGVGLLALISADALLRRLPGLAAATAGLPPLTRGRLARVLGPTSIVHAVYLAACSALVWWLALGLSAGHGADSAAGAGAAAVGVLPLLAAYPIAWAAGTVTPGAPGGIGVREAVLTLQLAGTLGEPAAALVAVVFRAVTVAGDLLISGLGWALGPRCRLDPPA